MKYVIVENGIEIDSSNDRDTLEKKLDKLISEGRSVVLQEKKYIKG